jgi:hypothetical protein
MFYNPSILTVFLSPDPPFTLSGRENPVSGLREYCFPFDFRKQSCLELFRSRGIVFEKKMKIETINNPRFLPRTINGPVFDGGRFYSRISSFSISNLYRPQSAGFSCFGFYIFSLFGSCLLVFGYFLVLVSCILYFISRSARCFSVNSAKQPCLKGNGLRSVVSENYFSGITADPKQKGIRTVIFQFVFKGKEACLNSLHKNKRGLAPPLYNWLVIYPV